MKYINFNCNSFKLFKEEFGSIPISFHSEHNGLLISSFFSGRKKRSAPPPPPSALPPMRPVIEERLNGISENGSGLNSETNSIDLESAVERSRTLEPERKISRESVEKSKTLPPGLDVSTAVEVTPLQRSRSDVEVAAAISPPGRLSLDPLDALTPSNFSRKDPKRFSASKSSKLHLSQKSKTLSSPKMKRSPIKLPLKNELEMLHFPKIHVTDLAKRLEHQFVRNPNLKYPCFNYTYVGEVDEKLKSIENKIIPFNDNIIKPVVSKKPLLSNDSVIRPVIANSVIKPFINNNIITPVDANSPIKPVSPNAVASTVTSSPIKPVSSNVVTSIVTSPIKPVNPNVVASIVTGSPIKPVSPNVVASVVTNSPIKPATSNGVASIVTNSPMKPVTTNDVITPVVTDNNVANPLSNYDTFKPLITHIKPVARPAESDNSSITSEKDASVVKSMTMDESDCESDSDDESKTVFSLINKFGGGVVNNFKSKCLGDFGGKSEDIGDNLVVEMESHNVLNDVQDPNRVDSVVKSMTMYDDVYSLKDDVREEAVPDLEIDNSDSISISSINLQVERVDELFSDILEADSHSLCSNETVVENSDYSVIHYENYGCDNDLVTSEPYRYRDHNVDDIMRDGDAVIYSFSDVKGADKLKMLEGLKVENDDNSSYIDKLIEKSKRYDLERNLINLPGTSKDTAAGSNAGRNFVIDSPPVSNAVDKIIDGKYSDSLNVQNSDRNELPEKPRPVSIMKSSFCKCSSPDLEYLSVDEYKKRVVANKRSKLVSFGGQRDSSIKEYVQFRDSFLKQLEKKQGVVV